MQPGTRMPAHIAIQTACYPCNVCGLTVQHLHGAAAAVSSAEDPEKLLDQVVTEMQEDLIKMRQASAQASAAGACMMACSPCHVRMA